MLFERGDSPQDTRFPWGAQALDGIAVCTLWATGADTELDGVFRIQARRRNAATGVWEELDAICNPFAEGDGGAGGGGERESAEDNRTEATARMVREYGVTGRELEGRPPARDIWGEVERFLAGGPVLVVESEAFEAWRARLGSPDASPCPAVGLVEAAALLHPGRLAARREELVRDLLTTPPRTIGPAELQAAWTELVGRFLQRDAVELALVTAGWTYAWAGLRSTDPRAAQHLACLLELVDRPSLWRIHDEGLLPFGTPPPDGRLSAHASSEIAIEHRLDAVVPRAATEDARWRRTESLPPDLRDDSGPGAPFHDEDRRVLDDVFQVHLPKLFAREGDTPSEPRYRKSQHDVASAVADALGGRELLLVHAPTGTGKTIAYLVPALLWARRHGVRVGIATYTRALQEQAMDREVPRVLASLAAAGLGSGLRVSLLKGRENYICWRALRNTLPSEEDYEPSELGSLWLAWTTLVLFGLTDPDGDLNRLPRRAPLPGPSESTFVRLLQQLVRQARGEPGCCTHKDDRETCAAEVARRKAERSHVVITNQAFALLRPEFFKHIVFDECEHLHAQAHSVFSDTVSLRRIGYLLTRLHNPDSNASRAPLDRLDRSLIADTPTRQDLNQALLACQVATSVLHELERAVETFDAWRVSYARGRQPSDEHSLLREYCTEHESGPLIEARCRFVAAGNELSSSIAALSERLDSGMAPMRGAARVRRQLELARGDLDELLGVVQRWIPVAEGKAKFPARSFHDVERDMRGELVLAARVLLPNEFLGRHVYPDLGCGVLISATTWLGKSFDPALRYLGLNRTARPSEDEERPAREVRTFRAPEVFDYARVVVATPRDAPSPKLGKDATLDYVRRFLAYLGERTRGRILCLFTNAQDVLRVGRQLEGFFRERRVPLWYQGMDGATKEELSELFRGRADSILLGVDTFWYGADFPGETLEYLVIVKLPYGVPDRYHHAQCAAIGSGAQRTSIYMPRALAKFRQGFGRLMRRTSDKGCVFVLDPRALEPRHREFLRELPIDTGFSSGSEEGGGARLVRGDSDRCVHEALAHMEMLADVRRRGLDWSFRELIPNGSLDDRRPTEIRVEPLASRDMPGDPGGGDSVRETPRQIVLPSERPIERPDVPLEDLPF